MFLNMPMESCLINAICLWLKTEDKYDKMGKLSVGNEITVNSEFRDEVKGMDS